MITIIGAGGVAKTILQHCDLDDIQAEMIELALNEPLSNMTDKIFIVAFGTNYMKERKRMFDKFMKNKNVPAVLDFSLTEGSQHYRVGEGTFLAKGSAIGYETKIGQNNFVGFDTVIDHNTVIGSHNYLSPGCTITSWCKIGDSNFIGAGVTISPEVTIGNGCTIGAGACLLPKTEVKDGETWYGVPARRKE